MHNARYRTPDTFLDRLKGLDELLREKPEPFNPEITFVSTDGKELPPIRLSKLGKGSK